MFNCPATTVPGSSHTFTPTRAIPWSWRHSQITRSVCSQRDKGKLLEMPDVGLQRSNILL